MQTLNLLRHALAKTICEGIVNCLIVTDSAEANIQLTRIHEHIFSRTFLAILYRRLDAFGLTAVYARRRHGGSCMAKTNF